MRKSGDALRLKLHNTGSCCTAQFVALAVICALSGCSTASIFSEFDTAENPAIADTPWPRLIDVPDTPTPGTYTRAIPDPNIGDRTQADLSVAAVAAEERAGELAAPVITEEEQADLILGYVVNQEVRALEAEQAAAEAKRLAEEEERRKANAQPLDESDGSLPEPSRMGQ